ncbi:pyrroline-5-carboxylate reductase [Ligilactobacillus animalis]|uniref:pyrroline-5-carboxylate reductase n=1 Tax=Ligilactobacillus animalis TaxID=1605 RepID=UPI00264999E0|nr:pyrroline-5-carboxylate reductase [Ligilactobacillus animalis]WKB72391.1 pyrroline-5-carboxylate reductase [Ligilactobacillus animalis]
MKLGFIGAGNMARAIINGWLSQGQKAEIYLHSARKASYEPYAKEHGLHACASNTEVVSTADIIFLAVKPIVLAEVLHEIKTTVQEKKPVIVSMVTGVSIAEIADLLELTPEDLEIIRIMPNVNAEIAAGMTALNASPDVTETNFARVKGLFEMIGQTEILPEKDFSTFVALAGSSPAYVYFFIDAMSRAGVKYGLKKEQATKIAAQAVLGSAQKVLADQKTPMQLVDDVCSPGGTTIAGLLAMEEAGFMTAVIKGMDATINKDQGK